MNKIAGLIISLITSLLGALLAATVLISTVNWGFESIFLAGLAALFVLLLGAFIYFQVDPRD